MDPTIYFPFGIPYYSNIDFISVYFRNISQFYFYIYYYPQTLAAILPPNSYRNYYFPKNNTQISLYYLNNHFYKMFNLYNNIIYTIE